MEVWVFWLAISLSPVQQYKYEPTEHSPAARRCHSGPMEPALPASSLHLAWILPVALLVALPVGVKALLMPMHMCSVECKGLD